MRNFTIRVIAGLFLFAGAGLAKDSDEGDLQAQVDKLFAEWNRSDSPGCALALAREGEIIYARGYGMADLEQGVAITPRTAFYVGSVSKQFTAMAAALLAQEGKIGLDDDIRHYVPELPHYGNTITIRHLVHHTSGLRDYLALMTLSGRSIADAATDPEVVDLIARQEEINFPPGSRFLYSNSGYFLLAEIVKRVTGTSLREYAQDKIFRPLGMRHSHFHDRVDHIIPFRAAGHHRTEDGSWGVLRSRFALVGSGGLFTTVEDLVKWNENFYHNRLGKGGPELMELVQRPARLNSGEELDYAFGLFIGHYRGLPTVSHGGALGGYRAHLHRFPEQHFSIAIECNLNAINPSDLALKIADIYLADSLGPKAEEDEEQPEMGAPQEDEDDPGHLSESQLEAFAGRYHSRELGVDYRVERAQDQLRLRVGHRPPGALRYAGDDVLRTQNNVELHFQRSEQGEVTGFILQAGRVKDLRFEKRP
ncbi:MAG TPA: serine hydrolase domain-containing protein [Acidobacteriota bacterium]|nr:serine hydrolase domain-containing protein [Acidobacteriota bacterium]